MNAKTLIDNLHRRGVRLRIDGEVLRWFAPVGVVTEADLSALRERKAEVLAILREEQSDRIEERAAILQFDAYLSRRETQTSRMTAWGLGCVKTLETPAFSPNLSNPKNSKLAKPLNSLNSDF